MNDPKAVVYLAIDDPKNTIQYGGVVATPILRVKKYYKNQTEKELLN